MKYYVWIELIKPCFAIEVEAENEEEAKTKALEEAPFEADFRVEQIDKD